MSLKSAETNEFQCIRCRESFEEDEINESGMCDSCDDYVDKENISMQATYDSLYISER